MKYFLCILIVFSLLSCSKKGNEPKPTADFDAAYFPIDDGDTWYFTSASRGSIVRTIDGDTTISGKLCKRILENGKTFEAWSIIAEGDSAGFYVHLLTLFLNNDTDTVSARFDPPLRIPFNMEPEETYAYESDGYYGLDGSFYTFTISGTMRFKDFIDKDVTAGSFANVARLHYETDGYYEYYAEGVGLLDNEDFVLDSAFIDGKWIR